MKQRIFYFHEFNWTVTSLHKQSRPNEKVTTLSENLSCHHTSLHSYTDSSQREAGIIISLYFLWSTRETWEMFLCSSQLLQYNKVSHVLTVHLSPIIIGRHITVLTTVTHYKELIKLQADKWSSTSIISFTGWTYWQR